MSTKKTRKKQIKNKSNTTFMVIKYVTLSVLLIAGIGVAIFGLVKLSGADIEYDEAIIRCDDKDYSSYVKTITTSTPGNEEINRQIELYKKALENAAYADDYYAYGQLNAEYQRLLLLQSQTSTTNTSYDYTEADKAKSKCKNLAYKQKEADKKTGLICSIIGGILAVISLSMIVAFGVIDYKKFTRKR